MVNIYKAAAIAWSMMAVNASPLDLFERSDLPTVSEGCYVVEYKVPVVYPAKCVDCKPASADVSKSALQGYTTVPVIAPVTKVVTLLESKTTLVHSPVVTVKTEAVEAVIKATTTKKTTTTTETANVKADVNINVNANTATAPAPESTSTTTVYNTITEESTSYTTLTKTVTTATSTAVLAAFRNETVLATFQSPPVPASTPPYTAAVTTTANPAYTGYTDDISDEEYDSLYSTCTWFTEDLLSLSAVSTSTTTITSTTTEPQSSLSIRFRMAEYDETPPPYDPNDEDHYLIDENDDISELHAEMEQFQIEDPVQQSSFNFAAMLNKTRQFTASLNFVRPVTQWLKSFEILIDHYLSRVGNPILIKRLIFIFTASLIVFLGFNSGILPLPTGPNGSLYSPRFYEFSVLGDYVHSQINPDGLLERLEYLTSMPHIAGTEGDLALSEFVHEEMKTWNMPVTSYKASSIDINYPIDGSAVVLRAPDGTIMYSAPLLEHNVDQKAHAFHGYSAPGNVSGPLVYANYGSLEDFRYLEEMGIAVDNCVVIVRYGGLTAGRKMALAQMHGAAAVLMFPDSSGSVFNIPEDAILRAGIDLPYPGSPNNPRFPRQDIISIPSLPISLADAKALLEPLKDKGIEVPENWKAARPEISSWYSGSKDSGYVVEVKNQVAQRKNHKVWNILAAIPGIEQQSRTIIIGAPRDSWCEGGSSNMASTVVLLELMRVLSALSIEMNWRPLRSIHFISWDAQAYNLAGPMAFLDKHLRELFEDAYTYIDLTNLISGDTLQARGHPAFESLLKEVLDMVMDRSSAPDSMLRNLARRRETDQYLPPDPDVGSAKVFQSFAGIPSINLGYASNLPTSVKSYNQFPEGSCYDNMDLLTRVKDPPSRFAISNNEIQTFTLPKLSSLIEAIALLALRLSNDAVYPYDPIEFGTSITKFARALGRYADKVLPEQDRHLFSIDPLLEAGTEFVSRSSHFKRWKMTLTRELSVNNGLETPIWTVQRWTWNGHLTKIDTHLLDGAPYVPGKQIPETFKKLLVSDEKQQQLHGLYGTGNERLQFFRHVLFGPQEWPSVEPDISDGTFPAIKDALRLGAADIAMARVIRAAKVINEAAERF
ncbi:hypothetical protein CANCADRAFT_105 [Tortispora caseinolytica NRRL Y-17796]|uniref:Transferrin receptor-like dimerisation domain-containing protein n=1 Tax=Tortispora caseinolytica NRRL Y-17796 TaxID=767744 RepID=A0A1E4TIH8_9ASCO|nr:hypothetical protein CANCADRAFT_105 [Tortispora caseinolytica NRRL Y-17796]